MVDQHDDSDYDDMPALVTDSDSDGWPRAAAASSDEESNPEPWSAVVPEGTLLHYVAPLCHSWVFMSHSDGASSSAACAAAAADDDDNKDKSAAAAASETKKKSKNKKKKKKTDDVDNKDKTDDVDKKDTEDVDKKEKK